MKRLGAPRAFIVCCALALITASFSATIQPQLLGSFSVSNPAFLVFDPYSSGGGLDLLISSFQGNPFHSDEVFIVKHIEQHANSSSRISAIRPTVLDPKILWPNEITPVPESVFNKRLVSVAGGFLVPLKTHGAITILDPAQPSTGVVINQASENWFYHHISWRDMNHDGHLDILTCRAVKPIFGATRGQMVWFENNGGGLSQPTPWKSHVIATDPDVLFDDVTMNVGGKHMTAVFISEFFHPDLRVIWVDQPGHWTQANKIHSRDIDNHIGAVFDVKVCDVNKDGRQDLLVTTNSATNGSVYVFEIPDDFRTGVYKKHMLATGLRSRQQGLGKGAPGSAKLLPETTSSINGKQAIVLSGDDAGQAFVLTPNSANKNDWSYTMTPFLDVQSGTVGEIAIQENYFGQQSLVAVPAYNKGKIFLYKW